MNRRLLKISSAIFVTLITVGLFGHVAHAQTVTDFFGIPSLSDFITQGISQLVNYAVMGMGFILALAGSLLNFSINLTLHIKDFVSSTPAIYTTWKAIRDVSGMFIIFALLYAALQLILDRETSSFGKLIKEIVVVGLLINFSFFFAGLGIDASNIVSVQLYNAIAPANTLSTGAATGSMFGPSGGGEGSFGLKDGGLSDIFMGALKIQAVTQTGLKGSVNGTSNAPAGPLVIFFGGIVAVLIEFVAALSFVAAAAAFIFRFVILLLLLAFSPIWIAANIIPELKSYAKDWSDQYKAMLTFMPVYLLLMYLALNVLTSNPNGLFGTINSTGVVGNGAWYSGIFVLGVNAFLVCFLLNMPLIVAVKMGGMAGSFIDTKKIGAGAIWKSFGKTSYQGTVSRAASKIADSEGFKNLASRNKIAALALKGTRATASDYNEKLAKQVAGRTKFGNSLGYDQHQVNQQQALIRKANTDMATGSISKDVRGNIVKNAQQAITNIKNERTSQYTKTIDSGSYDTLWLYKARKNKVAAANMHVGVWEAELKDLEKYLDTAKGDLKAKKDEISKMNKVIAGQPAGPTVDQALLLIKLQGEEVALDTLVKDRQGPVDAKIDDINNAKLTK